MKRFKLCISIAFLSYIGSNCIVAQNTDYQQPIFNIHQQETKESQEIYSILFEILADNRESVVKHMFYPFCRTYPLSSIKNEEEMLAYYDNIFNDDVKKKISEYTEIWDIGWRGMCMGNCLFGYFYDEGFKIYAVNYDSPYEQALIAQEIEKQKSNLHPSVREFIYPIELTCTSQYLIRIDKIEDGGYNDSICDDKYRLVCWAENKEFTDIPDIVVTNGTLNLHGTMQLYEYTFIDGEYKYILSEGEGLEIYKNKELILRDK